MAQKHALFAPVKAGYAIAVQHCKHTSHSNDSVRTPIPSAWLSLTKVALQTSAKDSFPILDEPLMDLSVHVPGEENAGHFFVGTQDKQLRTAISKIPAGASMFISVNGLHLEQPSTRQEKVVHQVKPTPVTGRTDDVWLL